MGLPQAPSILENGKHSSIVFMHKRYKLHELNLSMLGV